MADFFDEGDSPTDEQAEAAEQIQEAIDRVAGQGRGWGKTWLLNRAMRYIQRVDPHTEDLIG